MIPMMNARRTSFRYPLRWRLGEPSVSPSPALERTLSPSEGERDGARGLASLPRPPSAPAAGSKAASLRSAFTLVEIMVAIGILSMVLAAIYSSWTAILRGSKVGLDAAASAQRARITIRVLEDSLGSAQSFSANLPYYYFDAENGDTPVLSFVARLSKSFPRSGKFGDLDVRRVTFSVEGGPDGSTSTGPAAESLDHGPG